MGFPVLLAPLEPLDISDKLGQLEVPDDSFPGLKKGDRLLTVPCHSFQMGDLYVLAFHGEPYGLWRCDSNLNLRAPRILCWKDGHRDETMRELTSDQFEDVVVAKIAGWLHIHDRHTLLGGGGA